MDARPLRELLADLVGDAEARHAYGSDPAGYLAAHGHPDLPEPLVAEAVVSYADTAPVEVAEVLAPYVMAHGPVPDASAATADWFDLLTAPTVPSSSELGEDPFESADEPDGPRDWSEPAELDFGAGAESTVESPVETPAEPALESTVESVEPADPSGPEWTADAAFAPEPTIDGLDPEVDDEPLD